MNSSIVKFKYNEQEVEFNMINKNVMVNATEMGNIFNERVANFLRNENTKTFISSIKSSQFCDNLNILSDEDLIQTKGRNGTWMHRILALKFAAWLNPDFELWVYQTIDQILFGDAFNRRELLTTSVKLKEEIKLLKDNLSNNPEYNRLVHLQAELMRLGKDLKENDRLETEKQLSIF